MKLTPALFETFLKCPTKCYLRSTGQAGSGNAYAEWVREQNDAYRAEAGKRLMAGLPEAEVVVAATAAEDLKTATWRLALDLPVRAGEMESRLHAVERVPPRLETCRVTLIGACLRHSLPPEPLRLLVVLRDLMLLGGVGELDLVHAFAHPVEEELGGSTADAA